MPWNLWCWVLAQFLVQSCFANVNLYISQSEVRRLLGMTAELYYVRDGVVNAFAQQFVVPVPYPFGELCFTWENVGPNTVPYSIAVAFSNSQAMHQPTLNVSSRGSLPKQTQLFCVALPCTGKSQSEVDIKLQVDFNLSPSKVTSVTIICKKLCLEGADEAVLAHPVPMEDPHYFIEIGVSVVGLIVFLLLGALALVYCPRSHFCKQPHSAENLSRASYSPVNGLPLTAVQVPSSNHSFEDASSPLVEEKVEKTITQIPADQVNIGQLFLEGTFGCVYVGYLDDNESKEVFVKTLKPNASALQIEMLLQEGLRFAFLSHANILSVMGMAEMKGSTPFILYPATCFGNLKKWLLQVKGNMEGLPHALCTQDLVSMAIEVLNGLQYLQRENIIHKDLATRNCLVDDNYHVLIADTALSRDLFPNDYHCLGDNENRPVKWLAYETLTRREYSFASDVWSFGVLLWELTTLAQQPYADIDPFEVSRYLKDGYRLTQPVYCPDELYAVMAYCWAMTPTDRPSVAQLLKVLQKFHIQLNSYI